MKNDAVLTTSTTGKAEEAFVSRAEYDALKRENAELNQKLSDLKAELFNLRFQHAINQLENPKRIKAVKKDIARISTIIKENAMKNAQ